MYYVVKGFSKIIVNFGWYHKFKKYMAQREREKEISLTE